MATEVTMKNLRPFWGRVSLIESPVEEAERDSGLVVPLAFDGSDGVLRGVIVEADRLQSASGSTEAWYDALQPGTVVFYRGGTKIGDLVILEISEILAIEAE